MSEPYSISDPEFQGLVPEIQGIPSKDEFPDAFNALVSATEREFKTLNEMKDDDSEKKVSPTTLARKELIATWEDEADNVIFDNIDDIASYATHNPEAALAVAEKLREWADHFQFIGDLHAQQLRNKKYAGTSETDGDAVAQRERVSRLIENCKMFQEIGTMMFGLKELADKELPNLRGNKVGTNSTNVRKSSAYPVLELQMEFTVDGREIPTGTGISEAVIDYLFPTLGKHSFGKDVEHDIVKALEEENQNWTKAGSETSLIFMANEGEPPVEFKVAIVRKNEVAASTEDEN